MAVNYLNRQYGTDIRVKELNLFPPGKIDAAGVFIPDHHGDTLFYADYMQTGLKDLWEALHDRVILKNTYIRHAVAHVVTYKGEKKDNWTVFLEKFDSGKNRQNKRESFIGIKKLQWDGGRLMIANYNYREGPSYELNGLHVEIQPFEIKGKNFHALIEHMDFTDTYGLRVSHLHADYLYTPDSMQIRSLVYQTDSSRLAGNVSFYYSLENLKHFYDEVELDGFLEGYVATADANKLAGGIFAPGLEIKIKSRLEGVLNELEFPGGRWSVPGTALRFDGDMIVYELSGDEPMGVSTDGRLQADYASLETFMPGITRNNIPAMLKRLGKTVLRGKFQYQPGYVDGKLNIRSGAGSGASAFFIKWEDKQPFEIKFRSGGLQLDKLFDNPEWGNWAGRFYISGNGLSPGIMKAQVQASMDELTYHGYPYHRLEVEGKIRKGAFEGSLQAGDKALKGYVQGVFPLTGKQKTWNFQTRIRHWDLYRTGWIRSDTLATLRFSSQVDMKGNGLDNLTGVLSVNDLEYRRSGKRYALKFLTLESKEENGEKNIRITSDKAVNGYMRGKFRIRNLDVMFREIIGTVFTGLKPEKKFKDEYVRFKFRFDTNLLQILDPAVAYTRNTLVKGRISGKDNYIHTDLQSEQLIYDGISFYNTLFTIDNRNPIYNMYVQADSIASGAYTFSQIRAINLTIKDTVYLKMKSAGGPGGRDEYNISAKYTLDSLANVHFRFSNSYMRIKNKTWHIDPVSHANRIDYYSVNDSLSVQDVAIFHGNERFRSEGYQTPLHRELHFHADSIRLQDWVPAMDGFRFEGIVNAHLLAGKNNGKEFYNAEGRIADLKWNGVPVGNVNGSIRTISSETIFVDVKSTSEQGILVAANGYIDRGSKDLNVNLNLNKFPLSPFNALMEGIFHNIRGNITGHVAISGSLKNPQYHGIFNLFGAGLTVTELNTDYRFADREQIRLEGQKFVFQNNRFEDTRYHTRGILDGEISFYNFTNWHLDLQIDTDNLLVLNTGYSDEALYYGTAFVEGNAKISGYVNKIKIDAAVKSKPDTRIYIPLKEVETVGDDPYIKFYTEEEYAEKKKTDEPRYRIYEGLELNLDIDITQDAEIEIVLDQEFGSRLKSRGEGTVLMEINTEGKFNMWGTYQVVEGKYNFRYAGVIDKEFDVEPGSTLIWNGDPFRADLDIKAVYFIPAADITPLLTEAVPYTKRVPVKVIIYIKGDLMKPRIDFDVELPDASPVIRSEVEYALRDPDMRMLQVISLLYSGNFISPNVLKFDNRTAVEGNLSERVLSVFNSLLENDIFNVKLDYVPDRQDPNTNVKTDSRVGLTIQTKINKRIYINGKLAMPVGRYTKSSVSGDIEADIWLNDNGTIQLRIYNKRTEIEFVDQEESYTRGVGISFQVDFDTFKELLSKLGIRIEARD